MHENKKEEVNFDFSHSKLTKIPTTSSFTLKLDLSRNLIKNMDLPYLNIIKKLDLSDNNIEIISSLENVTNLKILDLSYNIISNMNFIKMNLEELYLICNDILVIENLNMPKLKILDLAVNEINKIENLQNCPELIKLYLGCNKITKVPDLTFLTKLRILDLQSNFIEEIDCLKLPKSLEELLLSENKNLISIKSLNYLENLSLLAVRKTKITEDYFKKEKVIISNLEIWN